MSGKYIHKRGKKYIYRRRIPIELSHLDPRSEIKISLKTEKYAEAVNRSEIYNQQIESFWSSLASPNEHRDFNDQYKSAVQLARLHGFIYKTSDQIASSDLSEIIERLSGGLESKQEVEAVLGGAGESQIRLSDCNELYWDLVHDRLKGKSEHQKRKWKNPRKAAMSNFIDSVGDMFMTDVDRSEVLNFRKWWNKRIEEGLSPISANKQLRYIKDMLQTVAINNEIDVDYEPLFTKINFRNSSNSRPPFEASFVQNELLPKLSKLSDRDRAVVMVMADTGARLSEIFGLLPEDIKLTEEIPYIWIRPRDGHMLKTKSSERKIPLVGTALKAFQEFPNGFKSLGNPDSFSGNINKHLKRLKLRPTPRHTIYSLRHTYKDRLRDIGAPEEIIDELMGHAKSGPKYGRGHKMETKNQWLNKIAYNI